MSFIHLNNHSEFSMLKSSMRIGKMIDKAVKDGQTSIALTDHGNMFGALDFYFTAKRAGIKAIIGCEIYLDLENPYNPTRPPSAPIADRLVLLAENQDGYNNLMKIVSFGYIDNFQNIPLIPYDILDKNAEGIIAIYGGVETRLATYLFRNRKEDAVKRLDKLSSIFPSGQLYLSIQDHGRPEEKDLNQEVLSLSKEKDLPVVALNYNHYIDKSDAEAHGVLNCIAQGEKLKEFENKKFPTSEYYFKDSNEMELLFDYCPEAIENTSIIAERCNIIIRDDVGDAYWPKFEIPDPYNNGDEFLEAMTWEKTPERYPEMTDEIRDRIKFELEIMKEMKVAGYMLIVQDFINWARDNDIPVGPGRGSAVGSAVSFILGITDIEPIQFGLLFERFLNPERVSMPDIDTDFSDKDRERVIQYVTQKYGRECVSQIVTYGSMKAKAVLKDVARALEIPHQEVQLLTNIIPLLGYDLTKAYNEFEEIRTIVASREVYKKLWAFSLNLEGLKRQPGIHAAAVIIAPSPLVELAPLYKAPGEESVVIQYDKAYAEDVGFLKMDFLGLRNLSVIKDALAMIKENSGDELDMLGVDLFDAPTYELLGKGLTVGVFQFESGGMQEYLRKLKPTCLEDMIAMNALYRPGPIENIPKFIDCKQGNIPIDCYHPDFESFLGETYGVIVYQEQVMLLAQKLAGFTLGGADILRRIMAKKKPKELEKVRPKFFDGAVANGYDIQIAERLWEVLLPFCNYAFNKSHSAAYAFIGYQTAFLKANYTAEYMAANMSSEINSTDRLVILLEDCKSLKVDILPPDINRSKGVFTVKDGKINYGLAGIKGVGLNVIESLLVEKEEEGEFVSLFDLTKRMAHTSAFNKRTLESLIMAGACDNFEGTRAEMHASVDLAIEYGARCQREKDMGQVSLFDMGDQSTKDEMIPDLLEVNPWTHIELLAKEKEVMGLYITGHPLEEYRLELEGFCDGTLAPESIANFPITENAPFGKEQTGPKVLVGGVITDLRQRVSQKTNRPFAFAWLEDLGGKFEVCFWSDAFEAFREQITDDSMVLLEGFVKQKREGTGVQLDVQKVIPLEESRRKLTSYIHLKLDSNGLTEDDIQDLEMIAEGFEIQGGGGAELMFHLTTKSGYTHRLKSNRFRLNPEMDLIHELQDVLGKDKVKLSSSN